MKNNNLEQIAKLIRYHVLTATTKVGSGHPTSCLSAVELMTALMCGGTFRYDLRNAKHPNNDRLIFSKGHAAPLLYALWAVAGALPAKQLWTLRQFGSALEGHPSVDFPYTEAATGSLGQGLSIGVGMALAAKLDKLSSRTFVLLGDSEMSEGENWEAMQIAARYQLDNLIGILDVNRLGQRGQTMLGHNLKVYQKRIEAFGWKVIVVEEGHNFDEVVKAFDEAVRLNPKSKIRNSKQIPNSKSQITNIEGGKPVMIIAKTIKGKGVSFLEDKEGWHGRALSQEELEKALKELGDVDKSIRGELATPKTSPQPSPISEREKGEVASLAYDKAKPVATRKAYGNALMRIGADPRIVVLDAEVSNSTYSEFFKAKYPERFFEMYIAEQNMVSAALGLARRGKIPFVSTFAAFFSRAFDQVRMSAYSKGNIRFCGSHGGVSIGPDGPSQMGLEDIAMFRSVMNSVVLYPSDAISTERLVEEAAKHNGIVYLRTTRKDTPIIYRVANHESRIKDFSSSPLRGEESKEGVKHNFKIGGSCVLRQSPHDRATVVAAGITIHEALAAYEELKKEGINIRVIDLYSIKPLDVKTLQKAARETKAIITVEDHYAEGGIGEAVAGALCTYSVHHILESLAVRKIPKSGTAEQLLDFEGISRKAIIDAVHRLIGF